MEDRTKIVINTYEKIAEKYAEKYFEDLTDSLYIDKFLKNIVKQGLILDVGSGTGQFSKYMMAKGFRVIGVDLSKNMLSIAKKKVTEGKFMY